MSPARYYLSIFVRRFPYFLVVAMIVSAVSIIAARALPTVYVSQMLLIVEAPQIPGRLAASTVTTSAAEQLQLVEQRLLTRPILLDIAQNLKVLPDQELDDIEDPDVLPDQELDDAQDLSVLPVQEPDSAQDIDASPDQEDEELGQIVDSLRRNTKIQIITGRNQASFMSISFEARSGEAAAEVLNKYLDEIQKLDANYRTERASDTLEFFEQEVERLSDELDKRSARILAFQNENSDALPSGLQFRMTQQSALQTNLQQIDQQIFSLQTQRENLLNLYTTTGQIGTVGQQPQTQAQQQLSQLRNQLDTQLGIYSESSPQIKILKTRIAQMEKVVAAEQATSAIASENQTGNSTLDLQLGQIDSQIATLEDQKAAAEERLEKVTQTIDQTPANAITLAELQREHSNIQTQYNTAVARLASASTGERIEVTAQGQRISVIEYPEVPAAPSKPNRMMIAGGGTALGIALGLGLIVLLEFLNQSARRPEDLIKKLNVWPIATIPYVRSRGEVIRYRVAWVLAILAILIGIPAGFWAVHTYYLPLDVIAERVIEKLEVYW